MFDCHWSLWFRSATVALAAFALIGCGDDDSPGFIPSPTPTLTVAPVPTDTAVPSSTATFSPTPSRPAPTATSSGTPTHTATAVATATATPTPTMSATVTPSFVAGTCFDPAVQASEPLCELDLNPRPCEWLIAEHCLLPYPSSFFLREDPNTPTGFRVDYALESLPANARGVHINPAEFNTLDGFSPGSMMLALFPQGVDLVASNVPPITDVAQSLAADSPTVVIDADSGERILHFTELDSQASTDALRALIVRPEIRLTEEHRYIVALRRLRDPSGALIEPPAAFRVLRDGASTPVEAINARRDHFEDIFTRLESAGVERDDLILAWDFVVASKDAITSRMLAARDQALAANGPDAPPFEVTSVEDNYNENIFRRIRGTFTVPLFMTQDAPGGVYNLDDEGVPRQNGTTRAPFTVIIPRSAVEGAQPIPGRALVYGHGFLGRGEGEITSGPQQTLARRFGFIIAATDWIGLSENDVQNTLRILSDLSRLNQLFDRVQQGFINTIFLGRAMIGANGFNSHEAFQFNGVPIIDTQALYYDGNSQGGTLGAAFMALSPDTLRGVLGVGTANYGFLLQRSIDFPVFDLILRQHYPSDLDRMVGLALIQQIADRGEPNGYTPYLVSNPLPGTPAKKILIHTGIDDAQVSHYSVEVQVRSLGIPAMASSAYPAYGIAEMAAPFDGSAWVPFDLNAVPVPLTNDQPAVENGVHEAVRRLDAAQLQLDAFLRPNGQVENLCGGPCAFRNVPGVIERPPSPEALRESSRAAAAAIDSGWLASRLAVLAGDEMEGRDNLTAGGARARAWLENEMIEIGLEPMGRDGFEQPFEQGVNLVGRIAGNDPSLADEYVVVSGHYDHLGVVGAPRSQCRASTRDPGDTICNGAADNGAGSVATLAVANALAHSRLGTRRSILVVFWDAEEDGLLGSRYFADEDPIVPLEQIAAMYSVDNVGGYIIKGVEDSFAIGTEYATGLREKVNAINAETGFTQWPVSSFFVGSDTGGRSDHLPFRLHGVPIIFFGSGSPPEYHTVNDEIDIVSFDKLTQITRQVTLMTADVANDDGRPGFVDEPVPQLDDARALLALGYVVQADPASLGLDDPLLIRVLNGWIERLERFIANPPTTAAGWDAYESFVKEIITTVYSVIGGA